MSWFSASFDSNKFSTKAQIAEKTLNLLIKKKTETTQRERKTIADCLKDDTKIRRAKIKVEHIIREDYMLDAMALIQEYCLLLRMRRQIVNRGTKGAPDCSIHEAVDSLIWATHCTPIHDECGQLMELCKMLEIKYGKEYIQSVIDTPPEQNPRIKKELISRLNPNPPKLLIIEQYLIAIADSYNVEYEPDQQVMATSKQYSGDIAPAGQIPSHQQVMATSKQNPVNIAPAGQFPSHLQTPNLPKFHPHSFQSQASVEAPVQPAPAPAKFSYPEITKKSVKRPMVDKAAESDININNGAIYGERSSISLKPSVPPNYLSLGYHEPEQTAASNSVTVEMDIESPTGRTLPKYDISGGGTHSGDGDNDYLASLGLGAVPNSLPGEENIGASEGTKMNSNFDIGNVSGGVGDGNTLSGGSFDDIEKRLEELRKR
jgi:hypothetical protein